MLPTNDLLSHLRFDNFYIITGGPGVGKTTLIDSLARSGYMIVPEAARQIIKEQMASRGDGVPWSNKERYTKLMLKASVESFKLTKSADSTAIFFDRGILDTLCYADMMGLGITKEMHQIATTYQYNKKVFILPPWKQIYHADKERKQTWEEAIITFTKMKDIYQKYHYKVIEVPIGTVEQRKNFILDYLNEEK